MMTGPFAQAANQWLNAALGFVYPEWCQICDGARATPGQGFVCDGCRAAVRMIEPPFCAKCGRPYQGQITAEFVCSQCAETNPCYAFARSAALAHGPLLEVIHRYKYNQALYHEPFLAGLLTDRAKPALDPAAWDLIVPVPLHPKKLRQREFNQAERLAKRLATATGIPMNKRLLRRTNATRTQTKLTRSERFENVRGAFSPRKGASARNARVVVVDDVFTTGATTNACAEALLDAGAASVCVWTVARGI
jgi:ComF family protein